MIFIRALSAAKIDEEVHRLEYVPTPFAEEATDEATREVPKQVQDIQALLEFIECQINTRTDFEFVQVSRPSVVKFINILHIQGFCLSDAGGCEITLLFPKAPEISWSRFRTTALWKLILITRHTNGRLSNN